MNSFTFDNKNFLMNGSPYTIISGAIHYFRVHPDYWEDRLKKLKACGFNTVETYICWNLHEKCEGVFDFEGALDVERFICLAEGLGLNIIIRPGPYICAEWELGGLPSWLLSYPGMALRCADPLYLSKVTPYYKKLFDIIRPHLCTNGGGIIMVQVENEYGSYGDDKEYMKKIVEIYRENGIDCMLFTADGVYFGMQQNGAVDGIYAAANFGSDPKEHFEMMKHFRDDQPLMCAELWCGWFEHWHGEHMAPRSAEDMGNMVKELFELNASFNFYMFHGGTNFGFMNGANYSEAEGIYQPTVTSYDYGALLNEAGDMTDNYFAVKKVIEKNMGEVSVDFEVSNSEKADYGTLKLTQSCSLFDTLGELSLPIHHAFPQTMEQLGRSYGYTLYRTKVNGPTGNAEVNITELRDRAHVFLDGKLVGIKERSRPSEPIVIRVEEGESAILDILVENMGRINYGYRIFEQKGIVGGVRLDKLYHFGWEHYPLGMENLSAVKWKEDASSCSPAFYRGTLTVEGTPKDTFVRPSGFTKGFVVVNGSNIGRFYNTAGPQKTLYLPAPILKEGENEVIVFESDRVLSAEISFEDKADLG